LPDQIRPAIPGAQDAKQGSGCDRQRCRGAGCGAAYHQFRWYDHFPLVGFVSLRAPKSSCFPDQGPVLHVTQLGRTDPRPKDARHREARYGIVTFVRPGNRQSSGRAIKPDKGLGKRQVFARAMTGAYRGHEGADSDTLRNQVQDTRGRMNTLSSRPSEPLNDCGQPNELLPKWI